jgi:hypothetical protein
MTAPTVPASSTLEACLRAVHRGQRPAEDFVGALAGATLWLLAAPTATPDGRAGTRLLLLPDPGHADQRLIAAYLTRERAQAAAADTFTPLEMPVTRIASGADAKLGLLIDPGAEHELRLAPAALVLLRS